MRHSRPFPGTVSTVMILLSIGMSCAFSIAQSTEPPWSGNAFSGDPKAIAAGARLIADSSETGVVVLLEETRIVLDAAHKAVETRRLVYRIGSDASREWSTAAAMWQPWRQQRPTVRARVITADGREVILDPKTLAETPLHEDGADTFGDARMLRAPLPAASAGAVVEIQIVVKDSTTLFDRGIAQSIAFGRVVPVLRTTLNIEAPNSISLRYAVRLLPHVVAARAVSGGRTTLSFESKRLDAIDPLALMLSSAGNPQQPYVAFSTGASWRDIADEYGRIVNSRIEPSNIGDIVKQAVGNATAKSDITERILQKVQRSIRYAAVQLGVAALVPTTPAETLKLEYGDCKDQAALMISMLRFAGIESYMVLLNAGVGPDVEAELPGFGNFNHAIVYVPGDTPLWIDPTVRFSRAGQLPVADQGRLALIVKPDTTTLVRTPEFQSRTINLEEISLAEDGPGRIVESREFFGAQELVIRTVHSEMKPADLQIYMENYADLLYSTAAVRNIHRSDPTDFAAPFKVQFEIADSPMAHTSGGEATYIIPLASLFADSSIVLAAAIDSNLTSGGLDFQERFVNERKYRVVPPPGYRMTEVPDSKTVTLGPVILSRDFSVSSDGAVVGTVSLDSGKRRYTAEELAAVRTGLEKLDEAFDLTISFEQIARASLDAGDVSEAFSEFRRLAELHPREAIHHTQLARAYLEQGLGEMARAEARRAVELEPDSARAYALLGWVLEHDLIGRRWKPGFDAELARKAFRKAVELAPDDVAIRSDFGVLLEYDAEGNRYGPGANLDEAIEQYRTIQGKLDAGSPMRRNLPNGLLRTGRFGELKGATIPPDIRLAAIAATDGPAAALREAGRLNTDARQNTLIQAGNLLIVIRLYEQASALLKAATPGPVNSRSGQDYYDQVGLVRRHEDLSMSANDPKVVVKRFLVEALLRPGGEALSLLLSKAGQEELRLQPGMKQEFTPQSIIVPATIVAQSVITQVDGIVSTAVMEIEGDDAAGFRIGIKSSVGGTHHLFVVSEGGQYRILTAGRNDYALARGALRHIDNGDLDAARRWLDWAADNAGLNQADPESLSDDAFTNIWFNSPRKDRDSMRQAAAALLSSSPDFASAALPILQSGRSETTGIVREGLDIAYATALMTVGRHEESVAIGQQLMRDGMHALMIPVVTNSMLKLNRLNELKAFLQENLRNPLHKASLTRLLAFVELKQGNVDSAEALMKSLVASSNADASDQSSLAWLSLYHDKVAEDDVVRAEKAVSLSRSANSQALRTLAALYAETGKAEQARALILQSLESGKRKEPDADDWYVFGRIYEQLGERAAAGSAYRKVTPPGGLATSLESAYVLAQRRLGRLETGK